MTEKVKPDPNQEHTLENVYFFLRTALWDQDDFKTWVAVKLSALEVVAYDDGYKSGYKNGVDQTEDDSFRRGYDEGYNEGFDTGLNTGFDEGYNTASKELSYNER
jgi:hypothetical protein